jgi:NAD(P)-dependent dehydrogenase (short-subunit alcohol dehydrogenase family)
MEGALALFSLEDRTAVVTGAASGLGRAIAVGLAQAGASVVAADLTGSALADVVDEIGGNRAVAVAADVTRRDEVEAMVREVVARTGRVDVLVNSAGIGARGAADEYPADLWERVLAVNLTGTFTCCQVAGQHMLRAGSGSIVNIASIGGLVGWAGSLGYQASKGGVVQLTRTLAVEWAHRGVRVNAIAPCTFETAVVARQREVEPDLYPAMLARIPLGRFGQPGENVGPALFLASDAATMVTGHILTDNGGDTAQ